MSGVPDCEDRLLPACRYGTWDLVIRAATERKATDLSSTTTAAPVRMPVSPARFDSSLMHRLIAKSRFARSLSIGLLARLELRFLAGHKDHAVLDEIRGVRRGRESLLSGNEAFTLYSVARAQAGLDGAMAEVGVFQGCSARIISLASGGVPLHLFDTFAGLPEPDAQEHGRMRLGHYAASLAGVQDFLQDRPRVTFYEGIFPDTASECEETGFSFVHLDVDLKSSTRACLEFFYPRMVPGGVILTHDYSYLAGVRDAFTEFLEGRRERVVELPSSQAMLIKV
jgi:O-methyltransferase